MSLFEHVDLVCLGWILMLNDSVGSHEGHVSLLDSASNVRLKKKIVKLQI